MPEHRASGLASAAVEQVLREARADDMPVSALYPAVLRPYRKLGFELAGSYTDYRLPLEAIPDMGDDLPPVSEMDLDRDLAGIKACFHRWVKPHTGPFEPRHDEWWTKRILAPGVEGQSRFVVVRGRDDDVQGFASFSYTHVEARLAVDFGLSCSALAATTGPAPSFAPFVLPGFPWRGSMGGMGGPPGRPHLAADPRAEARGAVPLRVDGTAPGRSRRVRATRLPRHRRRGRHRGGGSDVPRERRALADHGARRCGGG